EGGRTQAQLLLDPQIAGDVDQSRRPVGEVDQDQRQIEQVEGLKRPQQACKPRRARRLWGKRPGFGIWLGAQGARSNKKSGMINHPAPICTAVAAAINPRRSRAYVRGLGGAASPTPSLRSGGCARASRRTSARSL